MRVLSDLHLGHSGCVVDAVEQLAPLIEGAGAVVFNGDTYEELAPRFRERSAVLLEELRELCRSSGAEAVFLTGNHDPGISSLHYLEMGEAGVVVSHGDTLFPMVSPWSRKIRESRAQIERVMADYSEDDLRDLDARLEMTRRSSLVLEQVDLEIERSLVARLELLAKELWPPRRPLSILGAWMSAPGKAVSLLERYRPEARVMVFGHTHFPGVWRRGGKVAVNTGGYLAVLNARVVELRSDGVFYRRVEKRQSAFRLREFEERLV